MRPWLSILIVLAGCLDPQPPPAGVALLCAGDDECPRPLTCNVLRQRCVEPGSDSGAPTIVRAELEPTAVTNADRVTLIVEADEAIGPLPPELSFVDGVSPPPFSAGDPEGAVVRLELDLVDAAEGGYPLARIDVADVAGNVGGKDLTGLVLVVDRTAPDVLNARIVEVPAPGFHDLPGGPPLVVTFVATERLSRAALDVGGVPSEDCALTSTLTAECSMDLSSAGAAFADGENAVTIHAVDDAGNERVHEALSTSIDTAPPTAVNVRVEISAPNGTAVASAAAGGVVRVVFASSEPLSAPPIVTLLDVLVDGAPAEPPLALVVDALGGGGTEFVATLDPVPAGVVSDAYQGRIALVDVVGHAAIVALPTPVPFAEAVASGCPSPGIVCVDADGDGFNAAAGCATGSDCNDLDANVFPTALELPGDGVRNDCEVGADGTIDEAAGVFIDCTDGDDGAAVGAGSRAAPVATLARGVELLDGRPFLFLRSGADPACTLTLPAMTDVGLLGGLDAEWRRVDGDTTRVFAPVTVRLSGRATLDSVEITSASANAVLNLETAFLTRTAGDMIPQFGIDGLITLSNLGRVNVSGNLRVVRSTLTGFLFIGPAGDATIYRSTLRTSNHVVLGALDVVSSVVTAAPSSNSTLFQCTDITGNFGRRLRIFHSTLIRVELLQVGTPMIDNTCVEMTIVGSSFVNTGPGYFLRSDDAPIVVVANNFGRRNTPPPLPPIAIVNGTTFTIDEIAAFNDVVGVDDNLVNVPLAFDDDLRPSAESGLRDVGVPAFEGGAPSSVFLDFDGECRYQDGAADTGADED